jgi:hypothetical protein
LLTFSIPIQELEMKKTLLVTIGCFAFAISYGQEFDSLRAPKAWFAADRSTLSPTRWTDLSTFGNHAIPASNTSPPLTFQNINFNKALVFDGIDDQFKIAFSLESTAELSVLAVFQSGDTTERGIWGTENAVARKILLTTRRAIGPDTITDNYGPFERVTALNSIVQNWETTPVTISSESSFVVGSAGTGAPFQRFRGALAEMIVFNHALSFLERVQYETYLAIKYGTGLRSSNFVSSNELVMWHASENATYGNRIAGIGRDEGFHLYQKQSGSAYDSGLMVMSFGAVAASNQANNSAIENAHFILWGDNGQPLTTLAGTGEDTLISMVQRKWLVTATGSKATDLSTNLYIDAARLPSDPMGYWLVIDRSGQSNFAIDNLEFISPQRVENGKIVFENIRWDADGSGKDNFSFVRKRDLLVAIRKISDPLCSDETAGEVRIEVIAGEPSYRYTLQNGNGTVSRNWRESNLASSQSELTSGEYTLTVADGADETLTRRFTLTQPDRLIVDLGPDRPYDIASAIVLDASTQIPASELVSYQWESSFGFQSTGESITVTEPGVYRATVTRKSDLCAFIDEIAVTGSDMERISVYPTVIQSGEAYNIGVSLPAESSVTVKIFDSRGLVQQSMNGNNNSEYLFTTSVNDPGVYMVVIQTSNGIETRKIIAY